MLGTVNQASHDMAWCTARRGRLGLETVHSMLATAHRNRAHGCSSSHRMKHSPGVQLFTHKNICSTAKPTCRNWQSPSGPCKHLSRQLSRRKIPTHDPDAATFLPRQRHNIHAVGNACAQTTYAAYHHSTHACGKAMSKCVQPLRLVLSTSMLAQQPPSQLQKQSCCQILI